MTDEMEQKTQLPAVITDKMVELMIIGFLSENKISLAKLQERSLKVLKNEDGLKDMAELKKEIAAAKKKAEEAFTVTKKPYLDNGRSCDAGKKLVMTILENAEANFDSDYTKLLAGVAERDRLAKAKKAQDGGILKGIEDNLMTFTNMIIAAVSSKQLLDVESRINLEKSPQRAKKYGDFHAKAIERYDKVLLPIIRVQKTKVKDLAQLNTELLEAEAANDPDKMDALIAKVDEKSNEILQTHANLQESVLNQESFAPLIAEEVLPEYKVKRTNYSMEIADLGVALKRAKDLLEITINKEAAKAVLNELKEKGAFNDVDEVVVNGIKYIATKIREAL